MSSDGHCSYRGFSLIELMIALAVASILFFVALPGYQQAVIKSTRMAARAALMDVMSRQQQFFINNKQYALTLANLGLPSPYYIDGAVEAVDLGAAAYRIQLLVAEDNFEGVQATPLNRQAADTACQAYSFSRQGVRSVSGSLAAQAHACW